MFLQRKLKTCIKYIGSAKRAFLVRLWQGNALIFYIFFEDLSPLCVWVKVKAELKKKPASVKLNFTKFLKFVLH